MAPVELDARQHGFVLAHRNLGAECRGERPREAIRPRRAVAGRVAKGREHVAGLDRRQLIAIAEQDQPRRRLQRQDELAHQRQIDHRRFVDNDEIGRERIRRVAPETHRIGPAAEEAMQRARYAGQCVAQRRVDATLRQQLCIALAQRFGESRRRLAGRRGERDTQRFAAALRGFDGEHENARDRRRLAGAGAAGEQYDAFDLAERSGERLPIGHFRLGRKQRRDACAQPLVVRRRRDRSAQCAQRAGQLDFVFVIAAQRDAARREHERPAARSVSRHIRRFAQLLLPFAALRQRRRALRRDLGKQFGEPLERHAAVTERERPARERRRERDRIGRARRQPLQRRAERMIERTQPAFAQPAIQRAHAASRRGGASSASSASISARDGRATNTPAPSSRDGSRPRQKR